MKVSSVPSRWILEEGCRLDAAPFLSGAFQARLALERLKVRKDPLASLTSGHNGGIFNGPQFARKWVDAAEHGVPFMGSSAMLMTDLSQLPLLQKKEATSPKLSFLRLEAGTTLISCSGTIGRMVYVRPDMAGMWSSQHIMKVVPDPDRIPPGYLYAFLSSKFGTPLVAGSTYGAIIQHIEPEHLANVPIPRLGPQVEGRVHELVQNAGMQRAEASHAIAAVVAALPCELGLAPLKIPSVTSFSTNSVLSSELKMRFDAPYHAAAASEVEQSLSVGKWEVVDIASVLERYFKPPMFKRLWVDGPQHGTQFISGVDAYRYQAESLRYVSRRTPNFEEFILHRGWVVFQAAGQVYGLFGQPLYVHGWLEGLFCADDVYRLVPKNEDDGAYLFAFFKTPHGQTLIKRQACGNSIPRVWDPHIRDMRVPWPDRGVRRRVAQKVIQAHEQIEHARLAENAAIAQVEKAIEEAA